jgi:cell division protein FtsB
MARLLQRISPSAVLMIVLIVLTALWFGLNDNGLLSLYRERSERELYEERIRALKEENRQIMAEIDRLKNDEAYLESVARRELNMVKENEIIFRIARKTQSQTGKKDAPGPERSE